MKKIIALLIGTIFIFSFGGCQKQDTFDVKIHVPSGSTEEFVYSHEEISPKRKIIKISCGEGLGDTSVILKLVDENDENTYEPTYLTPGMPVKMEVNKGEWFKVGISVQNDTDTEQIYSLKVEGVEIRIEDRADKTILYNGKEYAKSELCDATLKWLALSDEERTLSSYFPPEFVTDENAFGITLTADHIMPTGMTLKCSQSGSKISDELYTGSWFVIEKWTQKDGWKEVKYNTTEEIAWTEEAWIVPLNDTVEWEVSWDRIYGKLPNGKYRIGKEFVATKENNQSQQVVYYAEFEILEE